MCPTVHQRLFLTLVHLGCYCASMCTKNSLLLPTTVKDVLTEFQPKHNRIGTVH